jgi:hypothetical protein
MIVNIVLLVLSVISLVVSIIALNNGLNKSTFGNMFINCTNKISPFKCRHAGPQCQWNSRLQGGGPYGGLGSCQQSLAVPGSFGNSRIVN